MFGQLPRWEGTASSASTYRSPQYSFPTEVKVSGPALDFVQRLLVKDASLRLTAKEALEHPWLQEDVKEGKVISGQFRGCTERECRSQRGSLTD